MSESKELANWETQLAAQAREAAASEKTGVERISLRAGVMTYMGNAVEGNQLDVYVLANNVEQVYYDKPWNPDNISPPACFSLDGDTPDPSVPHPPASECAKCIKFRWTSDIERNQDRAGYPEELARRREMRTKGKACSTRRRLALLPATVEDLTAVEPGDLAMLTIPVTSVKNFSNYVNLVAARTQRPPWAVVTNIKVMPDPNSQFKVHFSIANVPEMDAVPALHPLSEMALPLIREPFDLTPSEEDEGEEEDANY